MDSNIHNNYNEGITINEFFNSTINDYTEKIIEVKIDCLSGECLELNQDLKLLNESILKIFFFAIRQKLLVII